MYVVTKQQMYDADEYSKNIIGLSSSVLMENAGQKMADIILKLIKKEDRVVVLCGEGNNGGDGFVVARQLKNLGYCVTVIVVGNPKKYKGAAAEKLNIYRNFGYSVDVYSNKFNYNFSEFDVFIDAMFGIGFKGELKQPFKDIIEKINSLKAKVISLDIPTGVYCDYNFVAEGALKATYTLTVSFLKRSALSFPSREYYGKIYVVDAGIAINNKNLDCVSKCWTQEQFIKTFKRRPEDSSKHKQGKVLIVGGSKNMPGALILSTKACFCAGAGLIKLGAPNSIKSSVINNVFEATYIDTKEEDGSLKDFDICEDVDVVACGPGLSRNSVCRDVVEKVILLDKPIVLDADALYFLDYDLLNKIYNRKFATILTPHVGEMARLCGCSVEEVNKNRFELSKEKAKEYNIYLVLKGPFSLTCTPSGQQFVNTSGNEGLAKGGSGDVLTGIIAAFFAKSKNIESILNGVYIHGKASDYLFENEISKNSMYASDLVYALKKIIP